MSAIIAHNLVKQYRQGRKVQPALESFSLKVAPGELFGVIGPDGAGKTTLFRILTTLLLADSGTATINGLDVIKDYRAIRQQVGYMPGRFSLYQDLTVKENLDFFATIFGTTVLENYDFIRDIYQQIEPFKDRRAGKLSGGMKQKLALCCALIHRPSLLFLDEPTTGVDVVSRTEFWSMLARLRGDGITILVSTPYMNEAALCDRVALMQSGRLMSVDTPATLVESFPLPLLAVRAQNMYQLLIDIRQSGLAADVYPFGEYHHVVIHSEADAMILKDDLIQRGHQHLEITRKKADIEDCFIRLMKTSDLPQNIAGR